MRSQLKGVIVLISRVVKDQAPTGTQSMAPKINTHIIERKAPFLVTTALELATYIPNERALMTLKISPRVVVDENDAFRGSIMIITPVNASTIPATFSGRRRSVPMTTPTANAKIGSVCDTK